MMGDVWVEKWGKNKLGLGVDEEWGWKVPPSLLLPLSPLSSPRALSSLSSPLFLPFSLFIPSLLQRSSLASLLSSPLLLPISSCPSIHPLPSLPRAIRKMICRKQCGEKIVHAGEEMDGVTLTEAGLCTWTETWCKTFEADGRLARTHAGLHSI